MSGIVAVGAMLYFLANCLTLFGNVEYSSLFLSNNDEKHLSVVAGGYIYLNVFEK